MNLIDCFIDDFADAVKVKERNDREMYSLLEVRSIAFESCCRKASTAFPSASSLMNFISPPEMGAGLWVVAEQQGKSQAPNSRSLEEPPQLAVLWPHEVWVKPTDTLRSATGIFSHVTSLRNDQPPK